MQDLANGQDSCVRYVECGQKSRRLSRIAIHPLGTPARFIARATGGGRLLGIGFGRRQAVTENGLMLLSRSKIDGYSHCAATCAGLNYYQQKMPQC
jgi:hypothetical protein